MTRIGELGSNLYRGEVSFDFVGRRRTWYAVSAALIVGSVLALIFSPLKLGLEFVGGTELRVPNANCSVEQARESATDAGAGSPIVQSIGTDTIRVHAGEMPEREVRAVRDALAETCGVESTAIGTTSVGPSWGQQVTGKAAQALVVFLGLVMLFIWAYFREWRMAVAAIVALFHDLLITLAIYALARFEVTPATVIGFLTILGYSLYDTVVVFDKVRENTAGLQGGSRMTYSEAANLAVNQTLVRSINTSVVALLPVGAILFVGALLLGAGTLKDLALALFVGIAAGTYSSIFIATPLLAQLKERERGMQALAKRVASRRAGGAPSPATRRRQSAIGSSSSGATAVGVLDDVSDGRADQGAPLGGEPDESPYPGTPEESDGLARPHGTPTRGPRQQPRRGTPGRPSGKRKR